MNSEFNQDGKFVHRFPAGSVQHNSPHNRLPLGHGFLRQARHRRLPQLDDMGGTRRPTGRSQFPLHDRCLLEISIQVPMEHMGGKSGTDTPGLAAVLCLHHHL